MAGTPTGWSLGRIHHIGRGVSVLSGVVACPPFTQNVARAAGSLPVTK